MKTFFALLILCPYLAYAGVCDNTVAHQGAGWESNRLANLRINFPQNVNSWEVIVNFDRAVADVECWSTPVTKISDTQYKFSSNPGSNNNQNAGGSIDYTIQEWFNSHGGKPVVTSVLLNGATICGANNNDSNQTSAPVTTQKSTDGPTNGPTSATAAPSGGGETCAGENFDYGQALSYSLMFYEAQRSGKLPADNRISWRGDSALEDRSSNGDDLTGGYYDAGDYVKFNFPMAYTLTVLSWSGVDYKSGYESAEEYNNLLKAVKWGTDYLMKCHTKPNEFWGQVGKGDTDHAYWGRAEDMNMDRPAYKIDAGNPGSDLAGETAAAFAAASILFKTENPSYSEKLLGHAKNMYNFADKYRGKYSDSIPDAGIFYKSWGGYDDELAWGAAWMYLATNDNQYLTKAKQMYTKISNKETFSWEDKSLGVFVLLAKITGQSEYLNNVKSFCTKCRDGSFTTSPKGELYFKDISKWGSLRYASNAALICLQAADLGIDESANVALAQSQIDYALGSTGRSFVVGFGVNPPQEPHHRGSTCPSPPASCGWDRAKYHGPSAHILYGALVGGPEYPNDQFTDDRGNYLTAEVAMDYNAAFQATVAGLKNRLC